MILSKKTVHDTLATSVSANLLKINTIDTKVPSSNGLLSKTQYDSEIKNLEK